jgi:hypothetical protein
MWILHRSEGCILGDEWLAVGRYVSSKVTLREMIISFAAGLKHPNPFV